MARKTSQVEAAGPVLAGRITRARPARKGVSAAAAAAIAKGGEDPAPVHGQPPAWAESRPDLCDALPWFRSLQGGIYYRDELCWGCLVDADSGVRSYIDEEILITRIGGGCERDAEGNLVPIKDQDGQGPAFRALENSRRIGLPVGIVIGDRNTVLGRKLPHRYNVMAFFRITNIWYEKVGGKKGAKIRFEKVDLAEKSWWAAPGTPAPAWPRDFSTRPESIQCAECSHHSLRIFNEGWMCLYSTCARFWTLNGSPAPANLTYHPDFLNSRTPPDPTAQPEHSLVPDLLSTIPEDDADATYSRMAWKGIVCPQCKKCISRKFWKGWKCSDAIDQRHAAPSGVCTFEKTMRMAPISLRSVSDDFELGPVQRAILADSRYALVNVDKASLAPYYTRVTYTLNGVGTITHFVANKAATARPNGPNDLFRQLQVADVGLRRYPLQQSVVAGTLTSHFAVNYGMPYKYVVSVDSKGFDEAPPEIMNALGRLTWATEQAVSAAGGSVLHPNELLMLGYFEDMAIGFHDDGESSLGPTIATLSLGAKATMSIRMKYKYYYGCSKLKNLIAEDPVLDHCCQHDKRAILKDQRMRGEITEEAYAQQRRALIDKRREPPTFIKMSIHHGDFVVMHGENLQKYYEHAVQPDKEKKLRFALTARYVKPDHVSGQERQKGVFDAASVEYRGD
ncbi:hypothetical protein DTO027B5_717 [Paecilomyces variotii]|nr:hypothetical protein DTO032I3_1790 [Paecilomyces variotii]KAJ9227278.1 hypothetical protein DTO169C6_499 [Paecilomyces variotii]KAJ9257968.1 hypothetical protein DTO207G8_1745 [Paecilomyces variotii]KAJ9281049.1 hypothetical protein DTO021D3_2103 [Paecilomyces variotii]KAJ9290081.1 hypothetical protein DTO021C3_2439 [Paecilomyces variotii]